MSLQPDVNGASDFGPPIITAALTEDIYYLQVLLEHGADPFVRDFNGKSALDYARQYGKDDFLELLANHRP
jgi:ankyrin repeat protein